MVPLCINYKGKEQQYQKEISQIIELDLPAIMPKFNKSRVDPQQHGRYKRFVSTLTGILFDGLNSFVNHKKQSALHEGMKKLLARQKVSEGKVTALGTQIIPIAQTSLKEIERLQADIVESNKTLEILTQCVIHWKVIMDKFILKISYNANANRFFAFILGKTSANMERNLSKYQQLLAYLDHMMDGLDALSLGLLSHVILPPDNWQNITSCEMKLMEHFREYELAMTEIYP